MSMKCKVCGNDKGYGCYVRSPFTYTDTLCLMCQLWLSIQVRLLLDETLTMYVPGYYPVSDVRWY